MKGGPTQVCIFINIKHAKLGLDSGLKNIATVNNLFCIDFTSSVNPLCVTQFQTTNRQKIFFKKKRHKHFPVAFTSFARTFMFCFNSCFVPEVSTVSYRTQAKYAAAVDFFSSR